MIRILHAVSIMDRAGIETILMNYYRRLDRSRIQFDFITHREGQGHYDREIESLGGRIYHAPRLYPQNYPAYFRWMQKLFDAHPEYRVMHAHIDAMSFFPLLAAKNSGLPVRIAHSHSTKIEWDFKKPVKEICRKLIPLAATEFWACGMEAGRFLFGKRFQGTVLHNAIETERFAFRHEVRERVRRAWRIPEDSLVVGHVGRFQAVKNHGFLLEIFRQLRKSCPGAILMLAGDGELLEKNRQRAAELGIEKDVLFLGNRPDVHELLQAMDVFVLPSFYEGIPVVGVEAQASGLFCCFSDAISREAKLGENTVFLSLKQPAGKWAETIRKRGPYERKAGAEAVAGAGYDMKTEIRKLEHRYRTLWGE